MKGRRTDLSAENCGIARSLQVIGDWWSLLIVREAFLGRERFGEFQKSLGLAKNILSSRLKKLVEDGIFRIEADPASASSHRYLLTPKGERLSLVLVALWQWGEENCFEPGELQLTMGDKHSGLPLPKLQLTAHDGRVLGRRDLQFVRKETPASSRVARTKRARSSR